MLLKIGLIVFMQMAFDFRVTWTFLGLLAILSTSEAEKNAQCAKQQAPVSESERKNVTRSRKKPADDWEQIRKHINSSPANAKAWRIIRLLVRSTLAIPTPSQMLVSQQQMALIFHIKFSSGSKPSWFGGFAVHMELLIYNMLYCWKNVFWRFFWYICSRFSLQMSYTQGLYQCHVDSLSKVNALSVYSD